MIYNSLISNLLTRNPLIHQLVNSTICQLIKWYEPTFFDIFGVIINEVFINSNGIPNEDLGITLETLPIPVYLDWEIVDDNFDCGIMERILVSAIEAQ